MLRIIRIIVTTIVITITDTIIISNMVSKYGT